MLSFAVSPMSLGAIVFEILGVKEGGDYVPLKIFAVFLYPASKLFAHQTKQVQYCFGSGRGRVLRSWSVM